MKDILEYIVKAIVNHPDDVSVQEEDIEGIVTLTISLNQEDMGRVIGKGGKVIRALRNFMKVPAVKQNKKVQIQIAES